MKTSRRIWAVRAGIAVVLLWPLLNVFPKSLEFSLLGDAIVALVYTVVAVSLVVLIGWVGQISLAQASFVGVGAFATGLVVRAWRVPFPVSLLVAAIITAGVAAVLGVVALRVRGLYLAVATLIFAWMTDTYLFSQPWLVGSGGSSSIPSRPLGKQGTIPFVDFTSRRTFYYVALIVAVAVLLAVANLRESKTGRAFFAVKGSEVAAASLGVDVTRVKLTAFALSGCIAGIAGNLLITHQLVASPASFGFTRSLFYLSIAVVGGLTSLPGAVASSVLFGAIEELFFRVEALQGFLEVVSAVLLGAVLMFFPSGLAGIPVMIARLRHGRTRSRPAKARRRGVNSVLETLSRFRRGRIGSRRARAGQPGNDLLEPLLAVEAAAAAEEEAEHERTASPHQPRMHYVPGTATKVALPERERRTPVLSAHGVTVRFGGLTAVANADLEVRQNEIVGLIGPNGAGKTTLFNAVSGLNRPAAGAIELFGRNINDVPVHERARRGMGRTFQVIQLFPQLTVFDNMLAATHTRNSSGLLSHLVVTPKAVSEERKARDRVREVVALLNLEDVADRRVGDLPFGILRLVEVGRALVTGAPFVMLDEPASGLDSTETDRFTDLLFWVRQTLGVSLLLIEHDVRMVTQLSDYMYVLDRGNMIAHGTPDEVHRNPEVVAAYLGASAEAPPELEHV